MVKSTIKHIVTDIMLPIDTIILLLRDGKWHSINEIIQFSPISKSKTLTILAFLSKFGFIEMSENQVRLISLTHEFIQNIETIEAQAHH
jgi:predicted methyltransferase